MDEIFKNSVAAIAISIAVVAGLYMVSDAAVNFKISDKRGVSVTGATTKNFTSDLIVWGGNFSREGETTKGAYEDLLNDSNEIKNYLLDSGVSADEMVFSAIKIEQKYRTVYESSENGGANRTYDIADGYILKQSVTIESTNVNKIETISRDISKLIESGVNFLSHEPSYYYTKLDELKLEMIAKASENAKLRAQNVAENSGGKLGDLVEANLGVFQITAQNSADEFSDGGTFNTSAKNKTASITVRAHYNTK